MTCGTWPLIHRQVGPTGSHMAVAAWLASKPEEAEERAYTGAEQRRGSPELPLVAYRNDGGAHEGR